MAFGIDLGTTHTVIAWFDPQGRLSIIPNAFGESLTPTALFFDAYPPRLLFGKEALKKAENQPHRAFSNFKRALGDPNWLRHLDGQLYRPQDLSALLLQALCHEASLQIRQEIREVVLTVPAYFGETQRAAMQEAAELAGLRLLRLLNEPTAAAIAYRESFGAYPGLWMIFDMGGGTCDITILESQGEEIWIRASRGHARLGGQEWDERLLHEIAAQWIGQHGFDPLEEPWSYQELLHSVIKAKHQLSQKEETTVLFSAQGFTLQQTLSRGRFEQLSSSLLQQCSDLCHLVLDDAKVAPTQLQGCYLVGGATRMPMIQQHLASFLHRPPESLPDPEEAVARGAALEAAYCQASLGRLSFPPSFSSRFPFPLTPLQSSPLGSPQSLPTPPMESRLTSLSHTHTPLIRDIASHRLGLVLLDENQRPFVETLLPRYTPLPYLHQATYYTAHPQQLSISLQLVEGDSLDPHECTPIGTYDFAGLPPRPRGQPIQLSFAFNHSGLLSLYILDLESGRRFESLLQPPYPSPPSSSPTRPSLKAKREND